MPTMCELKIEAKAAGLRGFSSMKKAELVSALNAKKATPATAKAKVAKKAKLPKKAAAPLKAAEPKFQMMDETLPERTSRVTPALTPIHYEAKATVSHAPQISDYAKGGSDIEATLENVITIQPETFPGVGKAYVYTDDVPSDDFGLGPSSLKGALDHYEKDSAHGKTKQSKSIHEYVVALKKWIKPLLVKVKKGKHTYEVIPAKHWETVVKNDFLF